MMLRSAFPCMLLAFSHEIFNTNFCVFGQLETLVSFFSSDDDGDWSLKQADVQPKPNAALYFDDAYPDEERLPKNNRPLNSNQTPSLHLLARSAVKSSVKTKNAVVSSSKANTSISKSGFLNEEKKGAGKILDEFDVTTEDDAEYDDSNLKSKKGEEKETLTKWDLERLHEERARHRNQSGHQTHNHVVHDSKTRQAANTALQEHQRSDTKKSQERNVMLNRRLAQRSKRMQRKSADQRQLNQCLAYTNFLKTNNVKGPKLVQQFHATCAPAATAKPEDVKYKNTCRAIVGAVTPFASEPNWDEGKLCNAVLAAFNN